MKILLLGRNYASVINNMHGALKEADLDVLSITLDANRSVYNNYNNIQILRKRSYNNRIINFVQIIHCFLRLRKTIKRVDIVHVFSDIDLENRFISNKFLLRQLFNRRFKGKKFITFLGSEVRNPEIDLDKNIYYKYAYFSNNYEYTDAEKNVNSNQIQQKFSKLGFKLICSVETEMFINPKYFESYDIYHHPSIASLSKKDTFKNKRIKIVHSPTAPVAKGSEYILKAIAEIEKLGLNNVEFKILKGLSNNVYVKELESADILIDQLIWGWYGVATQQALQLGKIVICNLHQDRLVHTPFNPIINANIHNLKDVILELINMSENELNKLKSASTAFYEEYHSLQSVGRKCLGIYLRETDLPN